MPEALTPRDLTEARALLVELFQATLRGEAQLSGGARLDIGAAAVEALRETKVTLGNPRDTLIHLTPRLFEEIGIDLTPIRKRQMQEQFDFYYLTLTISLSPTSGAHFTRLDCTMDFGPKGVNEPIVQAIFPTSRWREVLHWGGELSLGLDGDLGWKVGVDTPTGLLGAQILGELQTDLASKNHLGAFVAIPKFTYTLGRAEIAATGEGNSFCSWQIDAPELQQVRTEQFAAVFKVPKGTSVVELTALVAAEPSFSWLTANLRYVFEALSESFQKMLRRHDHERRGKERLPIGDYETWTLALPTGEAPAS